MNADYWSAPANGRLVFAREFPGPGRGTQSTRFPHKNHLSGDIVEPHCGQGDSDPSSACVAARRAEHAGMENTKMVTTSLATILHRLRTVQDSDHLAPDDARLLASSIAELEVLEDQLKHDPTRANTLILMTVMQVCEILWNFAQHGN